MQNNQGKIRHTEPEDQELNASNVNYGPATREMKSYSDGGGAVQPSG